MLKKIWLIFIMVFVATILDGIVHGASPEFHVPFDYFPNKILFGTFWGLISLYFVRFFTKNYRIQSILVPLIVAILLQTKYFLQGYDIYFVLLFLFLHFLMFLFSSIFIFRIYEKELNS